MMFKSRGFVCWTAALLVTLGLTGAALAQQRAVVTTKDGGQLEGRLVSQNDKQVVLEISGIETPIPRTRISKVELEKSVEQTYRERRAKLKDSDLQGRYDLAYWLFQHEAYDLAARELADLHKRFPKSEKVTLLDTVVRERQKLIRQKQSPAKSPASARPRVNRPAGQNADAKEPQRLTAKQINLIRVYELPVEASHWPPISIDNKTIDKLFTNHRQDVVNYLQARHLPTTEQALRAMTADQQLKVIFGVKARELYGEVDVRRDPPALMAYRTRLNRQYVINYCGTSKCHGGEQAPGGLFVFQAEPNSDATVYTNFYDLNKYANAKGAMIDRDNPEQSLLFQYGLDRKIAALPHPDVPGWHAQFFSRDDPRLRRYEAVVDALFRPKPSYGISYTPPHVKVAPATQPAAK